MIRTSVTSTLLFAIVLLGPLTRVAGQTVEPPFDSDYSVADLGPIDGVPSPHGGLTFVPGDPHTLLIAGDANSPASHLYSVALVRDAGSHVIGFSGTATVYGESPYSDGGVSFGPGGVLFLSRYPMNEISQIPAGGTMVGKIQALDPFAVTPSPGGLNFVPAGFPGAGSLKIATWEDGDWYTLGLAPDGAGLWDVTSATHAVRLPGGPEGFVYVPDGSPQFGATPSLLVSEWSDGNVAAYEVDGLGDPVLSTRRVFVTDMTGPEGAAVDPLTGDFLFSTFTGSDDRILAVRGFAIPDDPPDTDPPDGSCSEESRRGQGYWHRQCLAIPSSHGGIGPGNGRGRGPDRPLEPGFAETVLPCADAMMAGLGLAWTTACEATEPLPQRDRCERAERDLVTLIFNVCSGRLSASCPAGDDCDAASIDDLMAETARRIHTGECARAGRCARAVHRSINWKPDPPARKYKR